MSILSSVIYKDAVEEFDRNRYGIKVAKRHNFFGKQGKGDLFIHLIFTPFFAFCCSKTYGPITSMYYSGLYIYYDSFDISLTDDEKKKVDYIRK